LLRRFKCFTKPKLKKRGRKPVYREETVPNPLKQIWLAANLPCSKHLKASPPLWLPGYAQSFAPLSLPVIKALKRISPAAIDRLLRPVRMEYRKHGRWTTKPGTLLRKQIPVKTNQWNETRPGFLEADTVVHCGDATAGMYVNTLDLVDIATGWTEQRAIRGKGETGVLEQIRDVERLLPFPLLGFNCDNGSEFLNHHLVRRFAERKAPVAFTRS
jgi:hypothetical protein